MAMPRRPTRRTKMFAWVALWTLLPVTTVAAATTHAGGGGRWVGAVAPGSEGTEGGRPNVVVPPAAGLAAPSDTLELVVVNQRPWTAAVAVTLSFAGGYGDDPAGAEGRAWLLGMVLERAARANLAETGATTAVEVKDTRTWVTLLTTSSDWTTAYRILTRTVFTDPLDPGLAGEARADLSAQLFFQRDAPVRAFELEARRTLLGAEHARPSMGTPSTVSTVTVEALETLRARIYRPERARVAVMGGVAPDDAASVVGARRTMASRTAQGWTVEGEPLPSRAPGWAWEEGGRYSVSDEITNNWIVAAYPFSGAAARRPMEFVAHLVDNRLVTDPPAPGLISRRVEVRELPGGPVLMVTLASQWPTARAWEQRVTDVIEFLSTDLLEPDFLDRQQRNFRSTMALELADPGREGRRLLAEAGTAGELGEPLALLEGLSSEEIQRTVADLGEPRVLVYGPGGPPS